MKLQEAENNARYLMGKHQLKGWVFKWNTSKRAFGMCDHVKRILSLSESLTRLNNDKDVTDTILHEIAHALLPINCNHGKRWKDKCIEIGAKPERCYDKRIIKADYKYIYHCESCTKEHPYFKKPTRQVACGSCCNAYNSGKWSPRFVLKLKETK